jgi:hypothetical protein
MYAKNYGGFLLNISRDGQFHWAEQFDGPNSMVGDDFVRDVAVGPNNTYVIGVLYSQGAFLTDG